MTLKAKDISKMNKEEREKKLKELKFELARSRVNASKSGGSKVKEIKKIIARILTLKGKNGNMSKMWLA